MKVATLRRLFGYRYDLKWESFTQSINEIFVVFQDSKDVLEKLYDFHNAIVLGHTAVQNDKLILLIKSMCTDLNLDLNKCSEKFVLTPFNLKQ